MAIEAIKEVQTMQELAFKYEIHPTQITAWKREFLEKAEFVFSKEAPATVNEAENTKENELYSKIGELQVHCPFYGIERMHDYLIGLGYPVGVKRVSRLYQIMNLRTIYRHGPPRET